MKTLQEIRIIINEHQSLLNREYSVKKIGIFGSYVRNEQSEESDLDVLVEFERPVSLLKLVSLENYLTDITGVAVDVVSAEDIRPELREVILCSAVPA